MATCPTSTSFAAVGLVYYLDHDIRPTLVVDLWVTHPHQEKIDLVFCNEALNRSEELLSRVSGDLAINTLNEEMADFRSWMLEPEAIGQSAAKCPVDFFGLLRTATLLFGRWRVLSGIELPEESSPSRIRGRSVSTGPPPTTGGSGPLQGLDSVAVPLLKTRSSLPYLKSTSSSGSESETGTFRTPFEVSMTEHRRFVQEFDWGSTPIGPIEDWPTVLTQAVEMLLANPDPVVMFWGNQRIIIYNQPYIAIVKQKHPHIMGGKASECFPELWYAIEPICRRVTATGCASRTDGLGLVLERSGFLEECFFSFTFLPLFDADQTVVGTYAQVFEVTRQIVIERRMLTTVKLSEGTAMITSLDIFWRRLVRSLRDNPQDVPLAAIYSVGEENVAKAPEYDGPSRSKQWLLEGAIGFPQGHAATPARLDAADSMEGFAPAFRVALERRRPTLLHTNDPALPKALLQGLEDHCAEVDYNEVVICPLFPTTEDGIFGCFALGVNPRRPYDEEYRRFIQMLSRQVENSLASVILLEKEKRKLRYDNP